jgi:TrmH family RNA methyltransferase
MQRSERVHAARRAGAQEAVFEGFHAIKHAIRFDADIAAVYAADLDSVLEQARTFATDTEAAMRSLLTHVSEEELSAMSKTSELPSVIALVVRPAAVPANVLAIATAPLIVLDEPRHPGNLGAVVRTAASTSLGGVISCGEHDPWQPAAIRGSQGLHAALPVAWMRTDEPLMTDRPVIGLDAGGPNCIPSAIPEHAIFVFGSERNGLSDAWRARCDQFISLPMREGVSSLNLAASVSAVSYLYRVCR